MRAFISLFIFVCGCVSVAPGKQASLYYFYLDKSRMKDPLDRVYFRDVSSNDSIRAFYDSNLQIGFLFLDPGQAYYMSELRTISGTFSDSFVHRNFSYKASPIKLKADDAHTLHYVGAIRYETLGYSHYHEGTFTWNVCKECITEAQILRGLLSVAKDHSDHLTPEWTDKIEKRLQEISNSKAALL